MRKSASGFTLVELAIVIVVMSILATVTVSAFIDVQARARDAQRDAAVSTIRKALDTYRVANGGYPTPCANVNQDCYIDYLTSYLSPKYVSAMPVPSKVQSLAEPSKFFNNGGTTSYTMLIFYESKPSCRLGVDISPTYYSSYPLCPNF